MSFLKINDPLKRDAIVKEYLELKKKIRSNFLSERVGEQQLQTDLSKFYKPITETQKATAREITEGLKPVREGLETIRKDIYNIPDIVSDMEAIKKYGKEKEEEEEEEEEEEDEEEKKYIGKIAHKYLNNFFKDENFGIRKEEGKYKIGSEDIIIVNNDIFIEDHNKMFKGTDGLWNLIMSKSPKKFDDKDYDKYKELMIITNALHIDNDSNNPYPKGNHRDFKWKRILAPIWFGKKGGLHKLPKEKEGYQGEGVVVIPSDPNALLERLDLLLASQEAGHTGVRNELVSICDELKRLGVLNTKAYKKLNHLIKK